jgi:polar amino acid transport system substrate-binding protein
MIFKKTAAVFVGALVLVSGVFASGNKQQSGGGLTITSGVLAVGMNAQYRPMEYLDTDGKTLVGFDVQLAKALADRMGLQVKFVDTAWDGIFDGVETNKYDCVISGVTVTEARLRAHNFTKPYMGNAMSMVLLKGSSIQAKSPEECEGLGVAYQGETTADFFMARVAEKGVTFTPYEYESMNNCFEELKLGRVDVIITDAMVAYDYVSSPDSLFEIVWQGDADETFGICLKKGNDALTAELDKALDALFADGTVQKISQDIFKMDMVSSVRE